VKGGGLQAGNRSLLQTYRARHSNLLKICSSIKGKKRVKKMFDYLEKKARSIFAGRRGVGKALKKGKKSYGAIFWLLPAQTIVETYIDGGRPIRSEV